MQVDDPPYLSVGTAVSAKYKGAFCEAKVSKVVRTVKCKVTYKMGLGNATVSDNDIRGPLRVGQIVQAKHSDRKELVEATITKIQDCSQYTVVFDDGDITTLRRTALCLKSGRHFNESETLDQLPLTHPEHFGNPVVGGRRGRRNRQLKDDSSDEEIEEENEPDLEGYSQDIGRVVSVESTEKKRSKDNWFPGLVVIPSAQPTVRINVKDEYLIRSFKDGRYYTVPKKEISEFNRDCIEKIESSALQEAVQKAVKFLDDNELPLHWEKSSLFHTSADSDSEDNASDSSDDEPSEEKDRFVAQLYKFMDEAGTPLNKTPTIANKDIDLHRLFRVVQKMGGHNRVTNQNKWRCVSGRLRLLTNQNTVNQLKSIYKKCLASYESFHRTLGVTMLNHTRPSKKITNRGRSLIRDKDRSTPVESPKPEKEEEIAEKIEEKKETSEKSEIKTKKVKDETKKPKQTSEASDTNSDATDHSESVASGSSGRPKRTEKQVKERKTKPPTGEKVKVIIERFEEQKKDEGQLTRSKSSNTPKPQPKEPQILEKKPEIKPNKEKETTQPKQTTTKPLKKTPNIDEEKKRGRKRLITEEKSSSEGSISDSAPPSVNIGDKLKVYYGPTHESKVTYEAKVIEVESDQNGPVYLVHYTGWNTRYDEWIPSTRIAENLSSSTKAKRLKQNANAAGKSTVIVGKVPARRGRGASVSSRSNPEVPRSTTPSSVTSTSSRTKSPAAPSTRSSRLIARQDSNKTGRRVSAQTDVSVASDSDSDVSESESELTRTRSGIKVEETELRTYRRKIVKPPVTPKPDKRIKESSKEDEDTDKEDDQEKNPKKPRKIKKSPEKSTEESDEDSTNPPKGRDFDLNQIRSELKGFTKALKVSVDTTDKETTSSCEDSSSPKPIKTEEKEPETDDKKPILETTSEDIYEFKEPEPFEFETRSKLVEDKMVKKRLPRLFEELDKSPKKKPAKSPSRETPTYKKTPTRKPEDSDDETPTCSVEVEVKKKEEDPFDKLVESPSFNIVKTALEKPMEPVNLFHEPPDSVDDYSRADMELSDGELFPTFSKPSPDRNTMDMEFSSGKTDEGKTTNSDDDEMIRAQIQRAIAQSSSTDEDTNDGSAMRTSLSTFQTKSVDEMKPLTTILGISAATTVIDTSGVKKEIKEVEKVIQPLDAEPVKELNTAKVLERTAFSVVKQTISPALQETDSSLLESIVAKPPMLLNQKLDETVKELSVKTGTKIADAILQKFNDIKNKIEGKTTENTEKETSKEKETKTEPSEDKLKVASERNSENEETKPKSPIAEPCPSSSTSSKLDVGADVKKRRRVISKAFIEESDTDSSDSEQLVIARSDDESQTTSSVDQKHQTEMKENENSNASLQKPDESQSQPVEERNFKFDNVKIETESPQIETETITEAVKETKPEPVKQEEEEEEQEEEEEKDPHLHSLLLCEEEIPRSPAPVNEASTQPEVKSGKPLHEMPFASAPSTSNSKMLLEQKKVVPPPAPLVIAADREAAREAQVVLENTPPTTPESTVSNLSPRGENGGISPNTAEDSCKSIENEPDYQLQGRNSTVKVAPYSEEDTQMTSESALKKTKDEPPPAVCKKRRRSLRNSEDTAPPKRGRKPLNRSRHNSDSDDTSEHSTTGSTNVSVFDRSTRSPRPSKYNFFVEFDPSLDSSQRIAVLQQKLTELRKTYADVKAELATVERRRKKIRRREREALKAAKQEMACA